MATESKGFSLKSENVSLFLLLPDTGFYIQIYEC